jgi:hypothetical protein
MTPRAPHYKQPTANAVKSDDGTTPAAGQLCLPGPGLKGRLNPPLAVGTLPNNSHCATTSHNSAAPTRCTLTAWDTTHRDLGGGGQQTREATVVQQHTAGLSLQD